MKVDSFIRVFAGTMVLVSVALVFWVSPWWLLFTCFIGLNLAQSGLTGFCPPSIVLRKLGKVDENDVIHWGGVPPRS